MASTVQEALLVLQTVLDTLLLQCTPPTITRTQSVTSTRYRDGIVLTSATLRNAFQIISRENTQQTLSQFFSRLFGQVYELLTNAYEIELASQLELVSDVITAVYQTSATDKYNVEQSWQVNTPVLHALIINLLEPTWSLLDRLRVRGDAKHAGDQIPSLYPLLRGASGTIGRALHVMQTASAVVHVASCKALIVTMLESTGVFCNPAQDVAFIRPGDLPPRLEALATLNCTSHFHITSAVTGMLHSKVQH
ncbi:hypothetical protein BGZ51_006354 [Haplosporangium sp. Z 767]|nr:hypothetical protein BGZ51_006354 [Haplosporangium sp. Z 767]